MDGRRDGRHGSHLRGGLRAGLRPGGAPGAAGTAPVVAFVLALAVALGLAAGSAGCGRTGHDGAGGRTGAGGRQSGGGTGSSGTAVPSAEALRSALLTARDVGLDTTVNPRSIGGASVKGCEPLAGTLNATMAAVSRPGQQAASSGFSGGGTGPFVAEGLTTKAPDLLAGDYARTSAALNACRSLTLTTGGTRLRFALTPVAFGGRGTSAARLEARLQGFGVKGYLAMRRFGAVMLSYYFFELGGGSSDVASSYYRQAVAKAGRVLSLPPG